MQPAFRGGRRAGTSVASAVCVANAGRRNWASVVVAMAWLVSAPARADAASDAGEANAPTTPARSPARMPLPVRLEGYLLAVHADDAGWAGGLGTSGFLFLGPLELGLSLTGESQLIGYSRFGLAPHVGLAAQLGAFDLDAAATAGGAFTYSGHELLSDDPGASGVIAFVGGRGGVRWLVSSSRDDRTHGGIGLLFFYEHDLSPYTVTYRYQERSWLFPSSEATERTGSVRIGTFRIALLLSAIARFD